MNIKLQIDLNPTSNPPSQSQTTNYLATIHARTQIKAEINSKHKGIMDRGYRIRRLSTATVPIALSGGFQAQEP